ncbi:MAG: cyclodeaminase/cyclohydrolase family protein [Flavobacteriales bacterium]|nr:cyclodeaminase/cyclohydrolase family protein [Flavobacteriales bacterium]
MSSSLLQLPTLHLLEKIGAGSHKPGSGSAASLNGILCCKLLLTVIELTLDPKRAKKYSNCKEEFESIRDIILNEIGPRLEVLFEEDSIQFDKAIKMRIQRDEEINQRLKNYLQNESLKELKLSTEIPIEISLLCIRLGKFAVIVFKKGFKSARGDSGVALGSALSGLSGCISIISLNLQSFPKSHWTDNIHNQKNTLKKEYHALNNQNSKLLEELDSEAIRKSIFLAEFIDIRKSFYGKSKISHHEIENLARRIQNSLWKYRDLIWSDNTPQNVFDILKPEKVIEILKYAFHKVETLGYNEHNEEIAGIINNRDFTITISGMYKTDIVNFTTAHELGHALMHDKIELHRDIPLDGTISDKNRPIEEIQADKFAAFFLLPSKIVTQLFQELFGVRKLIIDEQTARFLNFSSIEDLRKKVKNKRDLSRIIASCEYYKYKHFISLSKIFNVSTEAMAIRLEELNLIDL